jgi:hypothetical protein
MNIDNIIFKRNVGTLYKQIVIHIQTHRDFGEICQDSIILVSDLFDFIFRVNSKGSSTCGFQSLTIIFFCFCC